MNFTEKNMDNFMSDAEVKSSLLMFIPWWPSVWMQTSS